MYLLEQNYLQEWRQPVDNNLQVKWGLKAFQDNIKAASALKSFAVIGVVEG